MRVGDHDYRTEFAKKHLAEGLEQGLEQGRVQRSVEDLLAVLEARGLEATAEQLERIRGCSDLADRRPDLRRTPPSQPPNDATFLRTPPRVPRPPARRPVW